MKLRDPGTILDPHVREDRVAGKDVWALRVTYSPDVGEDTWYFYFDRSSMALRGYRFFHEEAENDGEYITFEGEIQDESGIRLPRKRTWYYNKDGAYLATDEIVSLSTK